MVNPGNSCENGSTLVECMVAAVVLAALAMGFGAHDRARDLAVRHAFEETVATRVLQSAIEEQRAAGTAPAGFENQPVEGTTLFDAALDCRVTELEPGLHEATWNLGWRPAGSSNVRHRDLTTRFCSSDADWLDLPPTEAPR